MSRRFLILDAESGNGLASFQREEDARSALRSMVAEEPARAPDFVLLAGDKQIGTGSSLLPKRFRVESTQSKLPKKAWKVTASTSSVAAGKKTSRQSTDQPGTDTRRAARKG